MKSTRAWRVKSMVESSQCWQGEGVSNTRWEACYTGIGHTEREGLDDALDYLAQEDWEIPHSLAEAAASASARTVCEEVDCEQYYKPRSEGCPCETCDLYWYVTVFVK